MDTKKDPFQNLQERMRNALADHSIRAFQELSSSTRDLMSCYRCAIMEIETKFRVLNERFSLQHDRNPIDSIQSRLKSPDSILDKMLRKKLPFTLEAIENNIFDIAGIRVVCSFVDDIYMLADCLLQQDDITLIERKDYIKNPKRNGYRSLHCKLMGNEGRWMEVHIGSSEMLRRSNYGCLVEREISLEGWIQKFKEILRDIALHKQENEFMKDVVTTFYPDDIIVFTSEGNRITLPKDATALDFAYETNSYIGEKAKYAIINDKLCSIKTSLRRGDRVKIGTDEHTHPKQEWLDFVKTYKANFYIRQYLRNAQLEKAPSPYILCTDCNPLPGDEVIGFRQSDGKIYVHKCNCPKSISLSAQQGDIIENVDLSQLEDEQYPVSLSIKGVDRDMFLHDLIEEVSNQMKLSIKKIESDTLDEIVNCRLDLYVHSIKELNEVENHLKQIPGIHEVKLLGYRLF